MIGRVIFPTPEKINKNIAYLRPKKDLALSLVLKFPPVKATLLCFIIFYIETLWVNEFCYQHMTKTKIICELHYIT